MVLILFLMKNWMKTGWNYNEISLITWSIPYVKETEGISRIQQ